MKPNSVLLRVVIFIVAAVVAYYARHTNNSPSWSNTPPNATLPPMPDDEPRRDLPRVEPAPPNEEAGRNPGPATAPDAVRHDLEHDEKMGGHTLRKHVGRTDEQLKERLEQESVSAASTFTDKDAAETSVGAALAQNQARIKAWLETPGHDNKLAFVYAGDPAKIIGRSLKRRSDRTLPCHKVNIVLASRGESYFVLTAYPEL